MPTYSFRSYPASAKATFVCPSCGKGGRTRTFTSECTVNPFNVNADGSVKTAQEVRVQSQQNAMRQREQFMKAPLCRACEDALSYDGRKEISAVRSGVASVEA